MDNKTLASLRSNIKTLNDFMAEALKNGNIAGYGEALKNQKLQIEMLQKLESVQPKESEKPKTINVFSRGIAESLCVDYGHFNKLISIRNDKKKPTSLIYVFNNTDNFEVDFNKLVEEVKKAKKEKAEQIREIDEAIKEESK